jgi:hypothetical protein
MHLPGWRQPLHYAVRQIWVVLNPAYSPFGLPQSGALHPNVLVYLRVRWYDPSSGTAGSFFVLNTHLPAAAVFV